MEGVEVGSYNSGWVIEFSSDFGFPLVPIEFVTIHVCLLNRSKYFETVFDVFYKIIVSRPDNSDKRTGFYLYGKVVHFISR